jgi:hypothetical protein
MTVGRAIAFTLLNTLSLVVFAHGEDKPGPHGGYIRMPGAFHTEVVKEETGYRIYLLDLNWKNPSVLDSSTSASIEAGKKTTELSCAKESDSFFCKSSLPQKGILKINAKREGQPGATSSYRLPLKFELPESDPMPEHKGH